MSIPPLALKAQKDAANPETSVWVSAHAGSGKTTVLTKRVVRLMLNGTPPGAILCLTYTKAAATNMATKVYEMLGRFALLSDADLRAELIALSDKPVNLTLARQLFAKALETPGGLKVQTIHAFCEKILHQFPFEANVPADFDIITDESQAQMLEAARLQVLTLADEDTQLKTALTFLAGTMPDSSLESLLKDLIGKRKILATWLKDKGGFEGVKQDIYTLLGHETLENLEISIINDSSLDINDWRDTAYSLSSHTEAKKTDIDFAQRLTHAASTHNAYDYLSCFYTKDFTSLRKKPLTKKITEAFPEITEILANEALRIENIRNKINAIKTREATLALLTVGQAMLAHYAAQKQRHSSLDFDDLIARTLELLTRIDATWVLYKLDAGIDHILVDEAQDTSPDQWALISALVEGFTGGESARNLNRTLFVVGDEKQSIFSFQGADPKKFEHMRLHFQTSFEASHHPFATIPLKYSFRTAQSILDFVDAVAATPALAGRLSSNEIIEGHNAAKSHYQGLVELWETPEKLKYEKSEDWVAPLDSPSDLIGELATRIAQQIKDWLESGLKLPHRDKPVTAGDILILMRRRSPLFHAIIAALKNADVAVAGADRLKLTAHIAVRDLCALSEAILNPHDDYALACLLKSPIFGLNEADLFDLCAQRVGTLRAQLVNTPLETQLTKWTQDAYHFKPSLFFATLLARDGLRAKFLARLGPETSDVLDEFVTQIEVISQEAHGDLRGTIESFKSREVELKRDMEAAGNAVRVMTVHGSKGLEADIVFLADTTSQIEGAASRPKIHDVGDNRLLWSPLKQDDPVLIDDAKAAKKKAEHDEYSRLLYVAMTRASSRLIICSLPSKAKNTWHETIASVMPNDEYRLYHCRLSGQKIKRWFKGAVYEDVFVQQTQALVPALTLPSFLKTQLHEKGRPQHTTPSLKDEQEMTSERQAAIERGIRIHKKLESLIGKPLTGLDAEIQPIVTRLLTHPDGALLFDKNTLAEVPLVGNGMVGQVDRLMIQGNKLIVADFKTGSFVPFTQAQIPATTHKQMQAYVSILHEAYPKYDISALVVYTHDGTIFNLLS